ncbi:hypothetical protein [Thiomicrorhabdus sp.]|uniref:hypothetical protein n=1 Tax=Thiomicrorhabdus sp. TaxID=2039724 RepID=UPI0029C7D3BB|nr:hypothetical protein [Thiomicrorhabdus sp.]
MLNFPDTEKKLRARISSYKSSLKREIKEYGSISDGAGKRYLLFWLYFALGDLAKFEEYIAWYFEQFPDDVGEPAQKLCWALGLRRMGKLQEAEYALAELMLYNLYLVPQILGNEVREYDIWYSSNYEHIDYFNYIPVELIDCVSPDDIEWLSTLYDLFVFRRMRKRHIEICTKLKGASNVKERVALLDEDRNIISYLNDARS